MKDAFILFSAPMINAILGGTKETTRRVVTHPRWADRSRPIEFDGGKAYAISRRSGCLSEIICPYGFPGNRIWVKETWAEVDAKELTRRGYPVVINPNDKDRAAIYRADVEWWEHSKWIPSIFMPRWASRITLRVESVRIEQLQSIREFEAIDEGAPRGWYLRETLDGPERVQTTYRDGFAHLWDEINFDRGYSWATNPWVWCVDFSKVNQTTRTTAVADQQSENRTP